MKIVNYGQCFVLKLLWTIKDKPIKVSFESHYSAKLLIKNRQSRKVGKQNENCATRVYIRGKRTKSRNNETMKLSHVPKKVSKLNFSLFFYSTASKFYISSEYSYGILNSNFVSSILSEKKNKQTKDDEQINVKH